MEWPQDVQVSASNSEQAFTDELAAVGEDEVGLQKAGNLTPPYSIKNAWCSHG